MVEKRKWKQIINNIVVIFLILFYWVWLFLVTPQATDHNTVELQKTISDVQIFYASHRGTDQLLLFCENECYLLDTGLRNQEKTLNLANRIKDKPATVTVWEHIPKNFFDTLKVGSFSVKQVVDFRVNGETYWNIEDHNVYQSRERTAGIIGGLFVTVVALAVLYLLYAGKSRKFLLKILRKGK